MECDSFSRSTDQIDLLERFQAIIPCMKHAMLCTIHEEDFQCDDNIFASTDDVTASYSIMWLYHQIGTSYHRNVKHRQPLKIRRPHAKQR